jgi:NADH-quinone oxidoreductase subunit N
MITILDAALPVISLVVFAVLTVPTVKCIRGRVNQRVLTLAWFALVFIVAFAAVGNLATKYYTSPPAQGYVSLPFSDSPLETLSSAFMIDVISIYMSIIFVSVSAVIVLYSVFFINPGEKTSERYYAIMLMLTAGLMGAVFSGDLLTLFIFWESAAAGASFLMLYKKNRQSLNATLKYIVMIVIASAFIVFGLSLVYGITGTLNFWAVKSALTTLANNHLLIIAFVFIITGYAIESAIVPFHFWLPDAYNFAPASTSAFLSALIDQGSYYVLIRVLLFILVPTGALEWQLMLAVMAAFTMIVGNLFALIQNNVKLLVSYICVADVGYNLVAITSFTTLGLQGNLYFFLIGGISTGLAFMAVGIFNHYGFKTFEDFAGLGRKMPLASLALLIAVLSFVGVPPLGGFIGKYLVFTAAIKANFVWLAVIGVLASVLQTAYLFRLVNFMYAKQPKDETKIKEPKKLLIPLFILVAAIIILGLFPSIVLDLIKSFPFIP